MNIDSRHFQIADAQVLGKIVAALGSRFRLGREPEQVVRRTFYDTFDWRIYQADSTLEEIRSGKERTLVLGPRLGGREQIRQQLNGRMPKFTEDFPAGRMRDAMGTMLAMRALLPQVEVRSQIRTLRVLDSEEKTVLRITLEKNSSRSPGRGALQPLTNGINLLPVRGYEKYLAKAEHFLTNDLALEASTENLLESALAAVGREPLDYSSKLNFSFVPTLRADETAKQIHLHLLNTIEVNVPGTRADIDSEFLHDLRVAVRRTRSALTQVKGVFPEERVEHFKEQFAWIGQITGPTRDMDVYLLGYDGYRNTLPAQFRDDLEPLHRFLIAHQKSEQRKLARALNSSRFQAALNEWREFLRQPPEDVPDAPNGALPVRKLASKRIYKIFQRVLEEGLAIHADSPAEDFHELRKNCKKLRYLLEFFQSLYPEIQVKSLVKDLKGLLDILGDFQDLEVQAYKLRELAHLMLKEGEVPADTLLAMGMLVDGLLRRQREAKTHFDASFVLFAAEQNQQTFRKLFGGKKKARVE